nr:PREDICTED: uncharacterized protein LOC103312717 [Tribolium castaneum]XP_015834964.1 PREDICTED: uncharacterized protein LOC103312717 [Tribolium castaneum]|eukprot:XP_015834963.1 PREDICTED: uncharacterized protein LOC103312717 [Tribolium castaneum]
MSGKSGTIPIIPKCCDCDSYTSTQKTIFLGICRGAVSVISLVLCVAFLVNFDSFIVSEHLIDQQRAKTVHSILVVISVVNIIHFFVSIFIILIARSNIGHSRSIKFWIIVDLAIATIFILCVLILLFTMPSRKLFLILGAKLVIISLFLSYRSSVAYVVYKSDEAGHF